MDSQQRAPRILVAGIGNIFLGDDAFGVEVAARLSARPLPACVRVVDFGIRGLDLVYALMDGFDLAILVDAVPRGGAPGTLYTIEPEVPDASADQPVELATHGLDPVTVLMLARAMGSTTERLLVVGCEPAWLGDGDAGGMGLSEPVQAAIDPAIALIEELIARATDSATPILATAEGNREKEITTWRAS